MSKFGLYSTNKTQINSTLDSPNNLIWKRIGVFFNGKCIDKTPLETNALGAYVKDGKLMYNGYEISNINSVTVTQAQEDEQSKINGGVNIRNGSITSGDILISSDNICVNITLFDYNRLRAGLIVDGYSRYSEDTVYYIVPSGDRTIHQYIPALVKGHKDIIYNSFDNSLPHNSVSDNTYKDPKSTPEIALRYFKSRYVNEGNGINLELEYYVDGTHYDSNVVHIDRSTDTIVYGVSDTFTTIIEDAEGNELYKRTTYAGQFKVTIDTPIRATGKSWFSIRTIDSQGRESVVLFYDIFITQPFNETQFLARNGNSAIGTYDSKGRYLMKAEDLETYGIYTFIFGESGIRRKNNIVDNPEYRTADTIADDKRNQYFYGYKNKFALERLMLDKKAMGYTGVVLYNANSNEGKSLNDDGNTTYLIDCHYFNNVDGVPLSTGVTGYNEIAEVNYKDALIENYPNDVFVAATKFYFVKAAKINGIWELCYPDGTGFTYTDDHYDESQVKDCEITIQTINNERRAVVQGTPIGEPLANNESIYDWIRRDGANIWRTSNGDILTVWDNDVITTPVGEINEVQADGYFKPDKDSFPYLCIKRLSTLTKNPKSKIFINDDNKWTGVCHNLDKYGDYCYFYVGERITKRVINGSDTSLFQFRSFHIPDNFSLDCNYCTILSTFAHDLTRADKSMVIDMRGCVDSHIANAKIVGFYGPNLVKEAFLRQLQSDATNGEWEGTKTVAIGASSDCSLTNVWIENSPGYELTASGIAALPGFKQNRIDATSNKSTAEATAAQLHLGFVNRSISSGATIDQVLNADGVVTAPDNSTLLREDSPSYLAGRNIALATTDFINLYNGGNKRVYSKYWHTGFKGASDVDDAYRIEVFDKKIIVRSAKHYYLTHRFGKFHMFFVHAYKKTGNDYILLKSYKTREHNALYLPNDTTHMVVTPYIIVESNNDIAVKEDGSNYAILDFDNVQIGSMNYTTNMLLDNCKVRMTKSAAIVGPSINLVAKDCEFIDIDNVLWWSRYTEKVLHVEENAGVMNHPVFINCKNRYTFRDDISEPIARITVLNFELARYPVIIGCDNLGFSGIPNQYYIEDSKLTVANTSMNKGTYNIIRGIVKNSSANRGSNYGFTNIKYTPTLYGIARNYNDEPVDIYVAINDCLLKINRNEYPLYGRRYNTAGSIYDASSYEEYLYISDKKLAFKNALVNTWFDTGISIGGANNIKIQVKLFYGNVMLGMNQIGGSVLIGGRPDISKIRAKVICKHKSNTASNALSDYGGYWEAVSDTKTYRSETAYDAYHTSGYIPYVVDYAPDNDENDKICVKVNGREVLKMPYPQVENQHLYVGNVPWSHSSVTDFGNRHQFKGGIAYIKIWRNDELISHLVPHWSELMTEEELAERYANINTLVPDKNYHRYGAISEIVEQEINDSGNEENNEGDLENETASTITIVKYKIPGLIDLIRTDNDNKPLFFASTGDVSFSGIMTISEASGYNDNQNIKIE